MRYNDSTIINEVNSKYKHYCNEFSLKNCFYDGLPIVPKRFPLFDSKCGTFFHMITKEKENVPCKKNACPNNPCNKHFSYNPLLNLKSEPRQICPYRLDNFNLNNFFNRPLLVWEKEISTKAGKKNRVLCYDDKSRYLVILDKPKNKNYVMLWTGYPIIYSWKHRDLINEYNIYILKTKKKHLTSCS